MATPLHSSPPRPRRLAAALTAAAAALLALPAAGQAAITTFGSDLSAPADITRDRGEDTAYWSSALASGTVRVPADGQIRLIRLKGMAIKPTDATADPDNRVHFQVLRPLGDGSVQVPDPGGTSQMFWVPFTGDPDQINTFHPENLCARAGDYVAFNTVGGFNPYEGYPAGTPYQIFSSVEGSRTRQYSHDEGTKNGAIFPAPPTVDHPFGLNTEHDRTELLMQMELGTGQDGTGLCLGGTLGLGGSGTGSPGTGGGDRRTVVRRFAGLLMPPIQAAWMSRRGILPVRTRCPTRTPAGCRGTLTLLSKKPVSSRKRKRKRRLKFGRARFSVAANQTVKVRLKLSKKAVRMVRRRRSLKATLKAVARDGGGQRKTTFGTVRVKRGRR